MSEFFRGERGWSQFLRLAYQLPRDSLFMAAWHTDPEAAREYIRQNPGILDDGDTGSTRQTRALHEWSPQVELLTTLINEVRGYRADYAYVSAQGKGGRKKPDYVEGPKTALEIELNKARRARHSDIRAALLPRTRNTSPKPEDG